MSDPTSTHEEGPHEGPIKTPKQLVLAVFFATVVPIIIIMLLVTYVAVDQKPAAGSDGLSPESVARRIQPVGMVEVKDATDLASLKTGEQVYVAQCAACHTAGVAGAPKLGDVAAWGPRLAQGLQTLLTSALKGKGAMGPQGGGDFTDFEIERAVVYLANKGGAKFEEPKAPAVVADASATSAAPAGTTSAAGLAATAGTSFSGGAPPAPAGSASAVSQVAALPATPAATATAAATSAASGQATASAQPALYAQACAVCHTTGVANSPKLGDKAAWAPRLGQGIDGLTASAIKGKGAMPPKGGSSASDAEIKAVVTYMVSTVK